VVVGWYTVGTEPTSDDVQLQKSVSLLSLQWMNADEQIMTLVDSPVLLVFGTDEASGLPLKVYEGARAGEDSIDKFAEVPYGVETGEAERIAVDGVSRGTDSDSAGEPSRLCDEVADFAVVSNLTTQRNAIQMLHERITVLLQYVIGVVNSEFSCIAMYSKVEADPQNKRNLIIQYYARSHRL